MDAILFSANPDKVDVEAAKQHLANHEELYWAIAFRIARVGNLDGFVHMNGGRVEYRVKIRDVIPFQDHHQADQRFKPEPWIQQWKENRNNVRARHWRHQLVITDITSFPYDTLSFRRANGAKVLHPPQGCIYVVPAALP